MRVDTWYLDADSEGSDLLMDLELKTGTPIMSDPRNYMHIFESGGNYYIWNAVAWTAGRFLSTSFDEILETMTANNGGTWGLECENCLGQP